MRLHENNNIKINKYISENKNNDAVLINAAITMKENEGNIMDKHNMTRGQQFTFNETQTDTNRNKPTIRQGANRGNSFSTTTHHRTNSITRDG